MPKVHAKARLAVRQLVDFKLIIAARGKKSFSFFFAQEKKMRNRCVCARKRLSAFKKVAAVKSVRRRLSERTEEEEEEGAE